MNVVPRIWLHHSTAFPIVHFKSFILVEPMLNPVMTKDISSCWPEYIASAYQRKDTWNSPEAALNYLLETLPYKSWDRRAITNYAAYGLRQHLAATFSKMPFSGVTLACPRMIEAVRPRYSK